jgi:hypothetical protein
LNLSSSYPSIHPSRIYFFSFRVIPNTCLLQTQCLISLLCSNSVNVHMYTQCLQFIDYIVDQTFDLIYFSINISSFVAKLI